MTGLELRSDGTGVLVAVKAQPGSRQNRILGQHGGALKVAVTAAPEKGKANKAISTVLANVIGVRKGDVQVVRGATTANKLVKITGITQDQLLERLAAMPDDNR